MSDQQARQTPIIDLLRDIPADARMVYEVTSTHHQSIPVGVLAKNAADEIERLTACLKKANDQAEHFEREWYLRGDEIERLTAERDDHARWRADLADKLHDRETTISAAWEALRSAGVHSEATIDDGIRLLRRQLDEARAEREAMANVLPGHYYMDPPDGGDVPVLEQLRRMATDAERYRDWLRGGANIPPESTRWARWDVRYWDGRHWNTLFAEQMDAAIDAAMGASNE